MTAAPAATGLLDAIAAGATPSIDEFIDALAPVIPALAELADTPQDPGWHAEGDVHVHTGMVLDELYALLDTRASHITGERRTALILGAALHDVAKPSTTRTMEIQGVQRIAAPRHEMIGRSHLIPRLMGLGLPWSILEPVVDLVGYHVTPKFLVVKGRERGAYQRLARSADPELLYWLELADMLGRTCADRDQQVEHIEMFALFAREYAAWRRFGDEAPSWRALFTEQLRGLPPATVDIGYGYFLSDLEAGRIAHPHEGLARSYRFRDQPFPELVVTVGPSGAGKSTWIERHLSDHTVISLDEIRGELGSREDQSHDSRVRRIARDRLVAGLRAKARLVWDATSLRRDFRDAITGLGRDYGALVTMVCFPRSAAEYASRNRDRAHPVPAKVLRQQIDGMQWPELHEAHRWLVIGPSDEVLASYGGLDDELPYGLSATLQTLRDVELVP